MNPHVQAQLDLVNQRFKALGALYREAARVCGLTPAELSIWSALLRAEQDYAQQDLCDMLCLPKQTVNTIVGGLIRQGYATLTHTPGTRNRKGISLTAEGQAHGLARIAWVLSAEQRALDACDPSAAQAAAAMLTRYTERLRDEMRRSIPPESADDPRAGALAQGHPADRQSTRQDTETDADSIRRMP